MKHTPKDAKQKPAYMLGAANKTCFIAWLHILLNSTPYRYYKDTMAECGVSRYNENAVGVEKWHLLPTCDSWPLLQFIIISDGA